MWTLFLSEKMVRFLRTYNLNFSVANVSMFHRWWMVLWKIKESFIPIVFKSLDKKLKVIGVAHSMFHKSRICKFYSLAVPLAFIKCSRWYSLPWRSTTNYRVFRFFVFYTWSYLSFCGQEITVRSFRFLSRVFRGRYTVRTNKETYVRTSDFLNLRFRLNRLFFQKIFSILNRTVSASLRLCSKNIYFNGARSFRQ